MLARDVHAVGWKKQGYEVDLQSFSAGEETGGINRRLQDHGLNAQGWLKSKSGTALCVSAPSTSAAKRHTSLPPRSKSIRWWDDNIERSEPSDIRIDTYRSSGQHVNTTGFRRAHHPPSHRHRGDVVGKSPTPKPRHRHEEITALSDGVGQALGPGEREAH
jgi:hypothetical protein